MILFFDLPAIHQILKIFLDAIVVPIITLVLLDLDSGAPHRHTGSGSPPTIANRVILLFFQNLRLSPHVQYHLYLVLLIMHADLTARSQIVLLL